ncbi:hypothetical protein E2C01_030889 [Portunus trituberculatus]|uniref:Uncharacterized protein n=1 Tax=Portunus trituberculatus TaxID=210409 RepID=A0A5B7ET22_PORTR|nr:hypothetical protein [Portunus trituberculatus]
MHSPDFSVPRNAHTQLPHPPTVCCCITRARDGTVSLPEVSLSAPSRLLFSLRVAGAAVAAMNKYLHGLILVEYRPNTGPEQTLCSVPPSPARRSVKDNGRLLEEWLRFSFNNFSSSNAGRPTASVLRMGRREVSQSVGHPRCGGGVGGCGVQLSPGKGRCRYKGLTQKKFCFTCSIKIKINPSHQVVFKPICAFWRSVHQPTFTHTTLAKHLPHDVSGAKEPGLG